MGNIATGRKGQTRYESCKSKRNLFTKTTGLTRIIYFLLLNVEPFPWLIIEFSQSRKAFQRLSQVIRITYAPGLPAKQEARYNRELREGTFRRIGQYVGLK